MTIWSAAARRRFCDCCVQTAYPLATQGSPRRRTGGRVGINRRRCFFLLAVCALRVRRSGMRGAGFSDREVFAHFIETFRADAADGKQVVNAFECAVGFAHLQDFFGGRRADARNRFQFAGRSGIDVNGFRRRLFGRASRCASEETQQDRIRENRKCS
jgi:hypothetical protein